MKMKSYRYLLKPMASFTKIAVMSPSSLGIYTTISDELQVPVHI